MHDPDWKQHASKYTRYPYSDFLKDWGPSGEWGIIKSHHIEGAATPSAGYSARIAICHRQRRGRGGQRERPRGR